jgi:hypothetical protein
VLVAVPRCGSIYRIMAHYPVHATITVGDRRLLALRIVRHLRVDRPVP